MPHTPYVTLSGQFRSEKKEKEKRQTLFLSMIVDSKLYKYNMAYFSFTIVQQCQLLMFPVLSTRFSRIREVLRVLLPPGPAGLALARHAST